MSELVPLKGWRLRRGWPLVGLLLALTFLGHDVAMAGDVQRPDPPVPVSQPHAAHTHAAIHAALHPAHVPPADAPASTCDVWRGASGASTPDDPKLRTSDGNAAPVVGPRAEVVPVELTFPPHRSAGERRALLQVFLI